MSTPASIVGGLLGSAASEAAAFAAGLAIGPTLAPEINFLANEAWNAAQTKALDPLTAAAIAAENVDQYGAMAQQAAYHGIAGPLFQDLYGVTLTAPGTGELLAMLRRGKINPGNFTHGLRKAKLEPMWDAGLADLANAKIPVADLAYMVVRGLVPDAGLLPVPPPATTTNVKRYPVANIDTLQEAADWGWDKARFGALVGRSGLSMAPVLAANAYWRNAIALDDYYLAIAEGDLRNEWRDAILAAAAAIPSPSEYAESWLRGWRTQAEAEAGAALHGMTPGHLGLLYELKGRPVTFHEITTGLARGGTYPSQYSDIPEPYRKSAQESDIRPEWASLHYHNRYTYPSAFVLRTLAQAGDLGGQQAVEQVLLEIGWKPSFATQVSTAWTAGSTTGDPHVAKAESKAWTEAQTSYIAQEASAVDVQPIFTTLGISQQSASSVLAIWNEIRALRRKQLTPAQIKKALATSTTNPATGQPWTEAEAIAALLARGYDQADATVLLTE